MKIKNSSAPGMFYSQYLKNLNHALENLMVTDGAGMALSGEDAFLRCCELCKTAQTSQRTIYFVGNGASATMASHMAADFSKNCGVRAMAFNDIALMTAVSNDIHYEECFAIPLERFAVAEDILVTVSSSGNSPNVIKVIERAREIGLCIITLSGMASNNRSRTMGDLNFWLPVATYGLVEAGHQVLLHCWLDTFHELYGGGNP